MALGARLEPCHDTDENPLLGTKNLKALGLGFRTSRFRV